MTRYFGLPYEPGQANNQPGVPIVLTPTKDVSDAVKVARNTVAGVLCTGLEDLTAARDFCPLKTMCMPHPWLQGQFLQGFTCRWASIPQPLLRQTIIIQNGPFALVGHPLQAFNNTSNSPEDIFAFQNNVASNTAWLAVMYASLNGMGRGDYEIQQVFLDRFNPADLRGMFQEDTEESYTIDNITMMYYKGVGTIINNGGINTAKWGDYYTIIPLIRLAEMYLIRAEANFEDPGADIGPEHSNAGHQYYPCKV